MDTGTDTGTDTGMDFDLNEDDHALAKLAATILADHTSPERLAEVAGAGGGRFDRELWRELAGAGVLAAALPAEVGGGGLGVLARCGVLVELGRTVAPVPYLPSIAVGAAGLAEFGTAEQRERWAVPAAAGELVVTAALAEGPVPTAVHVGESKVAPARTEGPLPTATHVGESTETPARAEGSLPTAARAGGSPPAGARAEGSPMAATPAEEVPPTAAHAGRAPTAAFAEGPPVAATPAEEVLPSAAHAGGAPAAVMQTSSASASAHWHLHGSNAIVPAAMVADLFLVPAETQEGLTVFLITPADSGVSVHAQEIVDGDVEGLLELDRVPLGPDRVLGEPGDGARIVEWLTTHATVGLCAHQLGVCEAALQLTAMHAKRRVQFDRPIGTFQAVGQRLADCYIDVEAIRLTLWQAAWRLSENLPARKAIHTAKFWAADGGHRVAHTAVHIHGGLGIDVGYPLHRYFGASKRNEFSLGGSTTHLRRIGALLTVEPA